MWSHRHVTSMSSRHSTSYLIPLIDSFDLARGQPRRFLRPDPNSLDHFITRGLVVDRGAVEIDGSPLVT